MSTLDIRGMIFDLDGVIADTAAFHYQAWQRLAEEENIVFSREKYFFRMSGTSREENLRIFTEALEIDEATKQAWIRRKQAYYLELCEQLKPGDALPGIIALLDEARAAGLGLALGSASKNARIVLEKLQLIERFDVIGDAHIVPKTKPAPDIFLWAAAELRLSPKQVLVLEDAAAGVEAALSGGFYVIGLGAAPLPRAHAQVPNLAKIRLDDLLALLSQG